MNADGTRRSSAWLAAEGIGGILHRSTLSAGTGIGSVEGRPVVGICNSWSELVHCNVHLRALVAAVKRGVLAAGGIPVEFPTISLSENLMKPTAMLYRNLMAMDVEESIRSHPFDAVVLMAGCDKTTPAQLMGAASAGVPAIMLTGGPSVAGTYHGRRLGGGVDLWKATDDLRAGRIDAAAHAELAEALTPSAGHCNEMGTASTMAGLCEALGVSLSGSAFALAVGRRRLRFAELSGRRAVELASEGLTLDRILTREAFENAITVLMATGGATNAIIHLLALAGRVGVDVSLADFDRIAGSTPVLVDVAPAGRYLVEELDAAGGVPALLGRLGERLHLDATTVEGVALRKHVGAPRDLNGRVIRTTDDPLMPAGGLAVLWGNLAPRGAVIKPAAASAELRRHVGPAVVFEGIEEVGARIDDPDQAITPDSVLVLRNCGPVGAPGMPEWGMLPIPKRLLAAGVGDMVRVSDARMSGTAFGTNVLHVAPEAAVGGPLAAVRSGDVIELDVERRSLQVRLDDRELAARLADWREPESDRRGYSLLYRRHVMQADQGCDFDFLARAPSDGERLPRGLDIGWIGGW